MAVPIGIEHRERGLEARGHEQVLQVRLAAVDEEFNNFLVRLDCHDNFLFFEVAALVDVDHVEYRPRRAQKLGSEFGVGRQSRALAALALVGQLLQPLREAAVDGFLPARGRG